MVVRGVTSVCTLEHTFSVYLQLGEEVVESTGWNSRVLGEKQEDSAPGWWRSRKHPLFSLGVLLGLRVLRT
jgi:hypothetical protein